MIEDFFKLGWSNIRKRKLRSWLTMIGIFIGIAAVVSLISLGQGLQNYIDDEVARRGRDKIMIMPKLLVMKYLRGGVENANRNDFCIKHSINAYGSPYCR